MFKNLEISCVSTEPQSKADESNESMSNTGHMVVNWSVGGNR